VYHPQQVNIGPSKQFEAQADLDEPSDLDFTRTGILKSNHNSALESGERTWSLVQKITYSCHHLVITYAQLCPASGVDQIQCNK